LAWERVSLRTKLTSISVALIGLLLVVSSFGTISLLRTYLLQNVDTLLTTTASTLSREDPLTLEARLASKQVQLPRLPSDFYIAYLGADGSLLIGLVASTSDADSVPNLAKFNLPAVLTTQGIPFEIEDLATAESASEKSRGKSWRMVAVPLTSLPGSIVVALPTGSNNALLAQYGVIGFSFGLLLLTLSALSIWLTISSALRPLAEVERTAKAVAGGDISQRLIEREGKTEIGRLNAALNSMLGSIESALNSRNKTLDQMRRFVADASHELRTPLVSVRGYAELYRMGALKNESDVAEAMGRIESEAIRMSGLVESLLALARLDEGKPLVLVDSDVAAVSRDAARDASVADQKREIQVVNLAGQPLADDAEVRASVDVNALRQVFTNLLANASRFSPIDRPISIALGPVGTDLVIEVIDHGEGIPKQLRDKVFERFYRVDNSRNAETGGSGLGLAIVQSIVLSHRGTIKVLETKGGGATFKVTIPQV
jgi:two-component system OmpR family sensor kinase